MEKLTPPDGFSLSTSCNIWANEYYEMGYFEAHCMLGLNE